MAEETLPDNEGRLDGGRRVHFEPFQWHSNIPPHATVSATNAVDFADEVRDIAEGLGVVLQIIEIDEIDEDSVQPGGVPWPRVVDRRATGALLRLCVTSMAMLGAKAAQHADWMVDRIERTGGDGGAQ